MHRQNPAAINLKKEEGELLVAVARKVLSNSNVAATNAVGLGKMGFDPKKVDLLIPCSSVAVQWDGYVFKKVEADPESPDNFGLFVRKTEAASLLRQAIHLNTR